MTRLEEGGHLEAIQPLVFLYGSPRKLKQMTVEAQRESSHLVTLPDYFSLMPLRIWMVLPVLLQVDFP